MIITTTEQIAGREISQMLGVVRGSTVRSRNAMRDLMAVFRNIVGGEIPEYTRLLSDSREQALQRMIEDARRLGADAVVGVRFSTSAVMQGCAEILAYGTAVRLR
ncbi:MAG: YbjQ family protein [Flavobacteriales bacterium]|nr:YbjQ family protein [Flavobacteriales bacterium]MCX7768597.1 YbjQ family protein [Flavobacteriales bacterium]MDW8409749.1 YbjQ family protein [Flavobacteriales bacterium]